MNWHVRLMTGLLVWCGVAAWAVVAPPPNFTGIVLDDDQAEYTGEWGDRAKQTPLVGKGYHHDNNNERGQKRACFTPDIPAAGAYEVQPDSLAITDWYMDSHACTTNSRPGFRYDGKLILTEESRPGQIPYRSLLPQGVDNLLVPVCLSATHIAWGAVRLEPVWMEIGDAAGLAAGLAKKYGVTPAALDADLLVRALCEAGFLVSFFNDKQPLLPELQYFGTKGFFHDYNARLDEVLRAATAKVWAEGFAKLRAGRLDANALAQAVAIAEQAEPAAQGTCLTRGAVLRQMWMELNPKRTNP